MKPKLAIPILLLAVIATMGFSAWGPERLPETYAPESDPPASREVVSKTTESNDTADDVRVSKQTAANQSNSPKRTTSSDAAESDVVETDCPLLKTRPFRRTLGYPCLACASWMEANAPSKVGKSSRRASLEADQIARAQAIDRLREHNIISAVDTRSSATILWVRDGFTTLNTESMQKVVDLVFTHCLVADHAKNMLLIYDSATRERIGTFTELRGLRMIDQHAKG